LPTTNRPTHQSQKSQPSPLAVLPNNMAEPPAKKPR
jgi:hypothetical protein